MKTRTTIKDIAARAGVSLSTVHASLNNKPGVGEQTRNRICEIAKELDYHSNTVAASLKRKAYCIAALFPLLLCGYLEGLSRLYENAGGFQHKGG